MNTGEIVSLNVSFTNISFDDDITEDDFKLVSNSKLFRASNVDEMRQRYRKVTGDLIDTSLNDHGFSLSPEALKFMANHHAQTKNTPWLHQIFTDHNFKEIGAMMGRQAELKTETKKGSTNIKYLGYLDKKHPYTDRADGFHSVSATIAHGDQTCSSCNTPLKDQRHNAAKCGDWHPRSNKAIHLETSFVTIPAYKTTSVDMMSSLMSGAIDEVFPPGSIADPLGDPKKTTPDADKETEALKAESERLATIKAAEDEAKKAEIAELKELLGSTKEVRELGQKSRELDI